MEPITNEEMKTALLDAGLPEQMIPAVEGVISNEDLKTEYVLASRLLLEQRAVLVYGSDSPMKEIICAKLMRKYMFKKGKTGRWLLPAEVPLNIDEFSGAGIITVLGMDQLLPTQGKVVAHAVRSWLPSGRAFILSVSGDKAFRSIVGDDLANYISHTVAVVNMHVAPAKHFL